MDEVGQGAFDSPFARFMESAVLWNVDATEAAPEADLGLERLP
jgi:hypothetical protein